MRRISSLIVAATAFATAPAIVPIARLQAQDVLPTRFTLGAYVSGMSLESDASGRTGLGGFGARLMFNRSEVAKAARALFDRASAGVFWTYGKKASTTFNHVGGEVDVALGSGALARLDPFLGLGAGVFHSSTPASVSGTKLTSTDLALTPIGGVLIPIVSTLGARGDVRLPVVFGSSTSVNFVAEAGLYLRF